MTTIMRSISAALLWAFSMAPVQAQGFPTKPVKFIVNYAPGGGTDIMARLLAEAMREDLGQPVIVENRAGAGGALGAAEVARAPANGHTVLVTAAGFLISPAVINSPGYDPVKDFTGVAQIAIVPLLVVTRPDAAATSIQDVIASARRGDKVSFASFGNATPSHLVGESINHLAKVQMLHVPYKGGMLALPDILSGAVTVGLLDAVSMTPFVKDGRLKALAVTGPRRLPALPTLPTLVEAGIPFDGVGWHAAFAPAGHLRRQSPDCTPPSRRHWRDPTFARASSTAARCRSNLRSLPNSGPRRPAKRWRSGPKSCASRARKPIEMKAPTVRHAVRVTRGIVYGHAMVQANAVPRSRPLLLDRYEPAGEPVSGMHRPLLVMAFGGAFHRGDRQADEFGEGKHTNTPVSAYCKEFASRGWVACSIDYRLVQEDPDPGATPVIGSPSQVPMSRVSRVREMLDLPPISAETVCATIEAATDDMAAAVRFVREQAGAWAIDPAAIVVGGFSAGARIALGAAYGERVGVAGVVSISGYLANDDLDRCVQGRPDEPPALLIYGEDDLDYIVRQTPNMTRRFAAAGRGSETWKVPGANHFYPGSSEAVNDDGRRASVEEAIAAFLSVIARLRA